MITLNPSLSLFPNAPQGPLVFDPVRLKTDLTEAFFLSGYGQQAWLADEMVASIEFAISLQADGEKFVISEGRLNELIAGVFAQTGYTEVAETYIQLQSHANPSVPGSEEHIRNLLAQSSPHMNDKLRADYALRIQGYIAQMELVCPTDALIIELAKNLYRQKKPTVETAIPMPELNMSSPMLSHEQLWKEISPDIKDWIQRDIFSFAEISPVFPVLRVRLDWFHLINAFGLTMPLTEISLLPHFEQLGEKLSALHQQLRPMMKPNSPFPMALEFTSSERFTVEALAAEWNPENNLAYQIALSLANYVLPHPYKTLVLRDQ